MRTQIFVNKYSFIKNQADANTLDVFIDGDIVDASTQEWLAYWGIETTTSYKSFRDTVMSSDAKRINIHINSGGGACADALAMHDLIKEQIANGANWHTYGKGIVASAATYPLLSAGDNMHISENCFFMIHNVSGTISGSIDECEAGVKMMRQFNNCARDLYSSYFGKPKETISSWMNAETWWSGTQMKNDGLIKPAACGPAENVLTNSISEKKWLFTNKAILNTINNSISVPPKNKDMKLKKLGNSIAEAIKNQLVEAGVIKNDKVGNTDLSAFETSITNGINTALEGLENEISEAVTNAVKEGFKGDAFETAVANAAGTAVTNLLAKEGNAISTAITNATKDLVPKTELETVKNDIATKLGTANRTTKPKTAKPENTTTEDEAVEDMEGWNR